MTEKVKYYVGLLGKFLIKRENTNYQKKSQALLKHSSHFFWANRFAISYLADGGREMPWNSSKVNSFLKPQNNNKVFDS
jgi:hypothetical protein